MLQNFRSALCLTCFIVMLLGGVNHLFAQRNCGTVNLLERQYGPILKDRQLKFEDWIKANKTKISGASTNRKRSEPYKIPVVVHIVHNGEPLGSGANITDAQVLSQIKVLNNDFQRLNGDAGNTPAEFAAVAGAMDIEFVLARRDPDGLPTTGIVRVDGNRSSWYMDDDDYLKSLSYWSSEDYLNIWVCNLVDYLGYAQFPISDLPGLEDSPENAYTDGVAIAHTCFGSIDDGNFDLETYYDKGRTATHEIGHFFGLKHIWGDDVACNGNDYVDDTPNQAGNSEGCPSHPTTSCDGVVTMFQNFLDYTDDACMNLFTEGQMDRMSVVIENSPRRASLLLSNGLDEPDPVPNDIGVRKIVSPALSQCGVASTPSIELMNYGTNTITAATIQFKLNEVIQETNNFSLALDPGQTVTVDFAAQTLVGGLNELSFTIISTNGVTDGNGISNNNILEQETFVPALISVPFNEKFNSMPEGWRIVNGDELITWELTSAPRENLDNKALGLAFRHYEQVGAQDILYTPVFSLENADTAYFFLDRANAQYEERQDGLKIYAIRNCGTLASADVVFHKSGEALSTAGKMASAFQPGETNDWKRNFIDLSPYIGESELQLAFVGINNEGNNLYIDNITVCNTPTQDLAIKDLVNPEPVACETSSPVSVKVENTGATPVTSLIAHLQLNGETVQTKTFGGLIFNGDRQTTLDFQDINLQPGDNSVSVEIVTDETAISDENDNNLLSRSVVNHQEQDVIPIRLTFQDEVHTNWANFNVHSTSGKKWQISEIYNRERALHFNAFSNPVIGDEAWFISPLLDFRRAKDAVTIVFDISYKQRGLIEDIFSLEVSTECGEFESVPLVLPEFEETNSEWEPQSISDWFHIEGDLSKYAGKENVRVAFKIVNSNGNNLFVDNVEFYLSNKPEAIQIENPFNIFGYDTDNATQSQLKIGFKLETRADVSCEIVNTMGQVVSEVLWLDVLNQVNDLPVENKGPGIYIVRLTIDGKSYQERILISN